MCVSNVLSVFSVYFGGVRSMEVLLPNDLFITSNAHRKVLVGDNERTRTVFTDPFLENKFHCIDFGWDEMKSNLFHQTQPFRASQMIDEGAVMEWI